MKILIGLICLISFIYANDIEYKGNIEIEYKKYSYNTTIDTKIEKTISGQLELEKVYDQFKLYTKLEALKDTNNNDKRDYFKTLEAYIKFEQEDYDIALGRSIQFWGSLEIHNLTDIYNKKNILNDPYNKNKKLGTNSIIYTNYFENEDELSFIIGDDSYIKYNGFRDDLDFAFIIKDDDKFLTYHTLVKDDTIYKMEFSYDKKEHDYYEFGTGIEHTLYSILDKKDLGLIVEYYKSDNTALPLQNDIFTGIRLTFNDTDDSDIIAGMIKNYDSKKESYSIEYNTRIKNKFKTKITYFKDDDKSIVGLNIGYYF